MTPSTSSEAEIRTLFGNWAKAVREGDMDGVLACHAKDVVMFDVPPPIQLKGIDAYRKAWELFFSMQPKGGFELAELTIAASETVAFCHSLLRIGDEQTFEVRLTIGLRKVHGAWLVTHEHHSAPIATIASA